MPESDQNYRQEEEGATSNSSDDAKTGHSFNFLHLLTSIDQLKKSLQDEEAESGQDEEKSRLPPRTCTAALTSMCIAKIKESLRQEQEDSNNEVSQSQPQRTVLTKPPSKLVYARIHSEDRPWKKEKDEHPPSAKHGDASTKSSADVCIEWKQRKDGKRHPTSPIDQWKMDVESNLQATSSVKYIDVNSSVVSDGIGYVPSSSSSPSSARHSEPTKSKIKRVGASMA